MKRGFVLVLLFFVIGCASDEPEQSQEVLAVPAPGFEDVEEMIVNTGGVFLEDWCQGWDDCDDYCYSYSAKCERYCEEHDENEYCQTAFAHAIDGTDFEPRKKEGGDCSEPIIFNTPPVNLDTVGWIVPLGSMNGDHVTPIDHQYYQALHDDQIEVTSPGDGIVTSVQRMNEGKDDDWRLIIEHSCSIESIYIHIDKLSEKLMKDIPPKQYSRLQTKIFEGEIIGWYDNNVDYNVVDYDIEIGLLNKESFSVAEDWKIHVQDPFLYFNDEIKAKMISLSQRSVEPYGGKIDYDVDGTLIGMWFF